VPTGPASDTGFEVAFANFTYSLNGTKVSTCPEFMVYEANSGGGGFLVDDLDGGFNGFILDFGTQLFSGPTSSPTLLTGTFSVPNSRFDFPDGTHAFVTSATLTIGPGCTSQLCILTPADGASPVSHFVALSGTGVPGDLLAVLLNNAPAGFVSVDADGFWEALPDVSSAGAVQVQVLDEITLNSSNTITVFPQTAALSSGPRTPARTRLLPLRHADILVGSDRSSVQVAFYGATWTHTALYLGGDNNGTPMIAEAVTPGEANGGQQVRSVSLENSLLWSEDRVTGFELRSGLDSANRDAIINWATTVTNRGLPYWDIQSELVKIPEAALDWSILDPTNPAFMDDLTKLNALKNATNKFICSTLVWAAYWNGSGHALDISDPNDMTIEGLSILGVATALRGRQLFIDQLKPVFVAPETFARSPKLQQIF
jgi:hypothetical protein